MEIKQNGQCHMAGWGMTRTDGAVVNQLRVVDASVISTEVWKKKWGGAMDTCHGGFICAGGFYSILLGNFSSE